MNGICSKHQGHDPECRLCAALPMTTPTTRPHPDGRGGYQVLVEGEVVGVISQRGHRFGRWFVVGKAGSFMSRPDAIAAVVADWEGGRG